MRRRRHLLARLDWLDPAPVGGGVIYAEDLASGVITMDHLPKGRGGYLFVGRPCVPIEEWVARYGGTRYPVPERS